MMNYLSTFNNEMTMTCNRFIGNNNNLINDNYFHKTDKKSSCIKNPHDNDVDNNY